MSIADRIVTVRTGPKGVPERFMWEGARYRITDTPTLLDPDYALITHPESLPAGWRFQGTSENGDTRIFDVLFSEARQEWVLLHTYS